MKLALHASAGSESAGQLSLSGLCSLCAVLAVVVVVSVPRLGRIARAENDSDARTTARFLADALAQQPAAESVPQAAQLLELASIRRTLADAQPAPEEPRALAYHGYLFEVVPVPLEWAALRAAVPGGARKGAVRWAVRARPRHPGASGGRAYLACPGGPTYARPLVHGERGQPAMGAGDLSVWRRVD